MPFLKASFPPAERKAITYVDMTGGIDYSTDAFQVDAKFWLDALNVDPAPGGGATMRRVTGALHSDTLPSRPRTLTMFDDGATPRLLIGFDTGELRYVTHVEEGDGVRQEDFPTTRLLGPGSGHAWRGVQSGKYLYLQDGVSRPKRWGGGGLVSLSTAYNGHTWSPAATYYHNNMPIGRLLAVGHNRIWTVIGDDKLAWSFPMTLDGGAEDWGDEDFVMCEPGAGGPKITALAWANDRLYVFKEHATYQVLGWSPGTFQLFAVSTKHGAAGPEAVATDGTRVFAYDTQCGLHVVSPTQGGGVASDEGAAFRPMRRLVTEHRISQTGADEITVGHVNDRVYVSVILDNKRQTLVLDLTLGAWTRYDLQLGDYAYFHTGGQSTAVACSWNPTRSYRVLHLDLNGDTDNCGMGAHPVQSWFRTSWMFDGTPTSAKKWHYVDFIMDAGDGQSVSPFMSYDWDLGTAVALGVVQADVNLADPFVMPTSSMVDFEYELLSPDAEATLRPWQDIAGADEMRPTSRKTTRRRVRIPALEATSVNFTVYGPTPGKRWSIRGIVPTYSLTRRPL